MTSEPLDVGVVGVGHLGRHHARLYASMPGVRLVGVADRDRSRAEAIADEFGCAAFGDAEDLIGKVRAASVGVPTEHHRDVAVRLLDAGIDVLVEKPLARSVEEADEINNVAERNGCLVMVGHTERFNPAVRSLSRVVDEPRFFEIHRLASFTARSTDIDVVLDLMIHDLDLVLELDHSEVVAVDAVGVAALSDKLDIANARIRLASGAVANLTASRVSVEPVRRVRVFQRGVYLSCDTSLRKVERYRVEQGDGRSPRIVHEQLAVEDGEPLALELTEFAEAVRTRSDPPINGRKAQQVMMLAQRVKQAIEASAVAK